MPIKLQDVEGMPGAVCIVLAESERRTLLRGVLDSAENEVFLAVGPEGGWTEDELNFFQNAGWISASLGSTTLRAETAAIAATAVVISELARRSSE
jgi:16S rRNA (uracil1498-N3)-methyltransferase